MPDIKTIIERIWKETLKRTRTLGRLLWRVGKSHFGEHNGPLASAGIAFYLGISLVPLLLLGVSVLGFFLGSDGAAQGELASFVSNIVPTAGDFFDELIGSLVKSRLSIGLILVTLLWLASRLTNAIRRGIDYIWGGNGRKRRWWEGRLVALAMLLGMLIFLLAGTVGTGIIARLTAGMGGFSRFLLLLIPYVLTLLFFYILYRVVPTVHVRPQAGLIAAIVTAVLFEAAKLLFTFYLGNLSQPGVYYGMLTILVVLGLWAYYLASIILLGAELAREVDKSFEQREQRRRVRGLTDSLRNDG
ncbi:YihY/virulence factor BrkB family protein [bacterium]|nr:YihY/virulence factor BrkB family protein [bacterium]